MGEDRMEAVIKATTHGKAREEEILFALVEQKGIRWTRVAGLAATLETIVQVLAARPLPEKESLRLMKQAHENIGLLVVLGLTQLGEEFERFSKKDEAALSDFMRLFHAKAETFSAVLQAGEEAE